METTRDFRQVAQSWLEGNYDEETKKQVKDLMENDPAGLEDAFYRNLEFGTGGLRGVMGRRDGCRDQPHEQIHCRDGYPGAGELYQEALHR